jgi:hypothetical protein
VNKKITYFKITFLVTVIAILSLSTTVGAEPKIEAPMIGSVDIELIDPGKVWIAGNTLHVKDSYWFGWSIGPAGAAPYERWYEHIMINLETGEGTFKARALVTLPMPDTFLEATITGTITDFTIKNGKFVNHGSGVFAGTFAKGTMVETITVGDGFSIPSEIHVEFTGMQKFPKDFVFP